MSEFMQGDAGIARNGKAGIGVLATAGIIAAGVAIAMRGGGEVQPTADEAATEWLDVVGKANPECVALVQDAGTGETYEQTVGDKEVTLVKADIGADQEGRLWTNSMRAPYESENPEAETKAGFCEDASFSVATTYTLGNVIYKGVRLADTEAGAWLKPIADLKPEELDNKAEYLLGVDLKSTQVAEHYARYQEHVELAENLAAVLTNLNNDGLQAGKTDIDVSYADASFVGVEGIPEMVAKNGQFDNAEALLFSALNKGEDCETPIIGFNTGIGSDGNPKNGDQRPETFVPEDCVEETIVTNPDGSVTTHLKGTTTTTNPDGSTTTTSWRTSNTVTGNTVIEQPGAGGDPDPDNDPDNNTTTSISPSSSTTDTTIRLGDPSTTTTAPQTECKIAACQ